MAFVAPLIVAEIGAGSGDDVVKSPGLVFFRIQSRVGFPEFLINDYPGKVVVGGYKNTLLVRQIIIPETGDAAAALLSGSWNVSDLVATPLGPPAAILLHGPIPGFSILDLEFNLDSASGPGRNLGINALNGASFFITGEFSVGNVN